MITVDADYGARVLRRPLFAVGSLLFYLTVFLPVFQTVDLQGAQTSYYYVLTDNHSPVPPLPSWLHPFTIALWGVALITTAMTLYGSPRRAVLFAFASAMLCTALLVVMSICAFRLSAPSWVMSVGFYATVGSIAMLVLGIPRYRQVLAGAGD